MNSAVVVDASLVVKWLVLEVHSDKAYELARSWVRTGVRPMAPHLMPVEAANALYRRAQRKDISAEASEKLLDGLLSAGIEMVTPQGLYQRALALASRLGLSAVYDACYLALADMLDCDLWTADERLCRSVGLRFPRVKWVGQFQSGV